MPDLGQALGRCERSACEDHRTFPCTLSVFSIIEIYAGGGGKSYGGGKGNESKGRERAKGNEWSKRIRKPRDEAGGELEGAGVGSGGRRREETAALVTSPTLVGSHSGVPGFLAWVQGCPPPTSTRLDAPELALHHPVLTLPQILGTSPRPGEPRLKAPQTRVRVAPTCLAHTFSCSRPLSSRSIFNYKEMGFFFPTTKLRSLYS